ncbi:MAG: glycoside hydrolase family 92 protein, partial [Burkholderiaceae bacterium]|nr:glycoside hydrolase family 92 protein [Burkholderiaceae bacterium]
MSRANARQNLETETGGKSFEVLVEAAKTGWEEKLALIVPETDLEKDKTIFYTALYRSFQMPTLFQDVNGEYTGFDKKVHRTEGFNYYTDLSLWDTFRTLHPLYMLIAPREQRDMLVSLVKMKEQGGYLPRWPSGCGYTGSMLGSPADMVISESWQKGIRDFDVKSAYE